jgi:hypothetical protein
MAARQHDALVHQRCLARAMRRAAQRQRAAVRSMRADNADAWRRARGTRAAG